jgi:gluconate kinase
MIGIPGAGKSFFGEHFAETFKAPIINVGRLGYELFPDGDEDPAIIMKAADFTLSELFKTDRTLVYEGVTATKAERQRVAKKATDAGYMPLFVWVQTESIEAKRRATRKSKDAPHLDSEQFDAIIKKFAVPASNEKVIVVSGKHTYASQLKIVLRHLANVRTITTAPTPPVERTVPSRNILIR